jgi:hypothetical protein
MKKLTVLLAGAILLMGMATTANALTLRYSLDNSSWQTVTDNGLGDANLAANSIAVFGSIGGFNSLQLTSLATNTLGMGSLFTSTLELSGQAATLYVQVSDFPYNISMPLGTGGTALSGLAFNIGNASVDFETFYGTGLFDLTNLIADFDLTSIGGGVETANLTGLANPFSLTETLLIHHNGFTTSQVTASLEVTPVPEPGTMLLLGAGFLGLAIYGKRRQNA